MSKRDQIKKLRRLQASIPELGCKGLCHQSCGPMGCSTLEKEQIEKHTGEEFPTRDEGMCPFLENQRCSIYPVRPTVCRLWGNVPDMACPYGCKPKLTKSQGRKILRQVMEITGDSVSNDVHTHPRFYKQVSDLQGITPLEGITEDDLVGHIDSLLGSWK